MSASTENKRHFDVTRKVNSYISEHFQLTINLRTLQPSVTSDQDRTYKLESVHGHCFKLQLIDGGRSVGTDAESGSRIFKLRSDPDLVLDAASYFVVSARIGSEWKGNAVMHFGKIDYRFSVPEQYFLCDNQLEFNINFAQLPVPNDPFPLKVENDQFDVLIVDGKEPIKFQPKSLPIEKGTITDDLALKRYLAAPAKNSRKDEKLQGASTVQTESDEDIQDIKITPKVKDRKTKKEWREGMKFVRAKVKDAQKDAYTKWIKVGKKSKKLADNAKFAKVTSTPAKSCHVQLVKACSKSKVVPPVKIDKGCGPQSPSDSDSTCSSLEIIDLEEHAPQTVPEKKEQKMPDLVDFYEAELHHFHEINPVLKVEFCETFEEKCQVSEDQEDEELPKLVESYEAEFHNSFSPEQLRRMQRALAGEEPLELNFDVD